MAKGSLPWPVIALGLLALGSSRSSSSTSSGSSASGAAPPAGTPRLTGGQTLELWTSTRRELLSNAVRAAGAPPALVRAALALSANETGWGHGEWDYNLGNIHAVGSQPRVRLSSGEIIRAYATPTEGADALVALLRGSRYGGALSQLDNPTRESVQAWAETIGRAGYLGNQANVPSWARDIASIWAGLM